MGRRHRMSPFLRARQSTSSLELSLSKVVRKMRSPQITGDEWPAGSACFQRTRFDGPNSTGVAESDAAIPLEFGPRNCGQLTLSSPHSRRDGASRAMAAVRMKYNLAQRLKNRHIGKRRLKFLEKQFTIITA